MSGENESPRGESQQSKPAFADMGDDTGWNIGDHLIAKSKDEDAATLS